MNFANVKAITIPEGDVRSIAIGGVTVWQKPNPLPYDAEVEYVESDGTQYVDTGVPYFADFEIGIVCPTLNAINALGSDSRNRLTRRDSANPFWQVLVDGAGVLSTVPLTTRCDMSYRSGSFAINGAATGQRSNPFAAGTLYLFTSAHNVPTAYAATIYYFRAFDSAGILVRDLQPVRVGTVGYLYDRANPTGGPSGNGLYGSETETPLVAGPDRNGGAA